VGPAALPSPEAASDSACSFALALPRSLNIFRHHARELRAQFGPNIRAHLIPAFQQPSTPGAITATLEIVGPDRFDQLLHGLIAPACAPQILPGADNAVVLIHLDRPKLRQYPSPL